MADTIELPDVNVSAKAPTTPVANAPGSGVTTPQFNPFTKRIISVTFQLAQGTFSGKGNTLTVTGLRTRARVENATLQGATGNLLLTIKGLTLGHINTLTKAGTTYQQANNVVSVAAGDVDGTLTTIFMGAINYAYPDFSNQPDVGFVVQAASTGLLQLKPTIPVSFPGPVNVTQALTQVLQPAGIKLQNNGVNATLASPYFPGTVWQQVQRVVKAANCIAWYDGTKKVLTIWPKTGNKSPGTPVLIAPTTGMIGYPQFQQSQIVVRTIFSPNTLLGPGQQIKVQSQLASAQGTWTAYSVTYDLSAETPGGPWEMIITAAPNQLH